MKNDLYPKQVSTESLDLPDIEILGEEEKISFTLELH